MRRISVVIALTLLLVPVASAQQSASGQSTGPTGIQPLATLSNCVTAQLGRIAVFTAVIPPNAQICNSGIYEPSPGTGPIGILNPNPVAALDVSGNINTSMAYQIGGGTVLQIPGGGSSANLAVGYGALGNNNGGIYNTAIGDQALISNTNGTENVATGYDAMALNTGGTFNTATGMDALYSNTTGNSNTASGWGALGSNTQGNYNVATGQSALYNNTTGFQNVATGSYALGSNTTAYNNTAIGDYAMGANTTGITNIAVGAVALNSNTTGNNNIAIGYMAATGVSGANSNNIHIGSVGSQNDASTIRIGDPSTQGFAYMAGIYGVNVGGVPVQINSNGQLGAATSSLRFKEQVHDMGDSTDALMKLRPVTFLYKPEYDKGERTLQYGLIAEEVAKVYPELVAYDKDGQPYSVRYQYLSTMLLNEVQKQYHRAEAEVEVIKTQDQKISELEQRLSRLEKLVESQPQTVAKN